MSKKRTLIQRLAYPSVLDRAWRGLNKSNRGSHGLSGQTIDEVARSWTTHRARIRKQLRSGEFAFSSSRGVTLPKPGRPDKRRPIVIAEVRDRVVAKAMADLMVQPLTRAHQLDNEASFAYQTGRSARDALVRVTRLFADKRPFVLEADLVDFFGSIDRERLLGELVLPHLPDDSMGELLSEALTQVVGNLDDIPAEFRDLFDDGGVPQGSPLSPLLANVYLAPFDRKMLDAGFELVRYADDFVVLCGCEAESRDAYGLARQVLEDDLGLKLHPLGAGDGSKTKITEVGRGFEFLGVKFDGGRLWPSKEKVQLFQQRLRDRTTLGTRDSPASVRQLLDRVAASCSGWVAAYGHTDIEEHVLRLDAFVNERVGVAAKRLGWRLESGEVLTEQQRAASGIPLMADELRRVRRRLLESPVYGPCFPKYWPASRSRIRRARSRMAVRTEKVSVGLRRSCGASRNGS